MLKLFASLALLALLYSRIDFSSVIDGLSSLPVLEVFLIYFASQSISALKWSLILREAGVRNFLNRGLASYFSGMFFNVFGLGTLGGDISRAALIRRELGSTLLATSFTIFDRVHGLGVLTLIPVASILFLETDLSSVLSRSIISAALLLSAVTLLYFRNSIPGYLSVTKSFQLWLSISLLSLISHLMQILFYITVFKVLGLNIPLPALLLFIPLVNLVSALPVSIAGLGLREAALVAFLGSKGLDVQSAAIAGAAWFSVATLSATAGAFFLPREVAMANTGTGKVSSRALFGKTTAN